MKKNIMMTFINEEEQSAVAENRETFLTVVAAKSWPWSPLPPPQPLANSIYTWYKSWQWSPSPLAKSIFAFSRQQSNGCWKRSSLNCGNECCYILKAAINNQEYVGKVEDNHQHWQKVFLHFQQSRTFHKYKHKNKVDDDHHLWHSVVFITKLMVQFRQERGKCLLRGL